MSIGGAAPDRFASRFTRRVGWWTPIRLLGFVLVSLRLAFVDLSKFTTRIPGNPGDAFLVLALLRWGGDHATSFYSGYWQGPMFASGHDTMAYTETFLPLTIPFRAIEDVTGSSIVAMNVLYVVGWLLCAECAYQLLNRLSHCRSASVVGSLAFTFSTIRMAQTGHFQLVFAFGIPLGLLALFETLERPTPLKGALLGLVLSIQFLTTAYFGLVLIVSIAGVSVYALLRRQDAAGRLCRVVALSIAGAVVLFLVGPVAVRYSSIQSSTGTRGSYPATYALRLGDFRAAAPLSKHLNWIGFLKDDSASRSSENFAYIGGFTALFTPVFAFSIIRSQRFRALLLDRSFEIVATVVTGAFAFAIAVGRGPILGVATPFYDIARSVIPGVRSMLALIRLVVFAQLALVAVATLALAWLLTRVSTSRMRILICLLLSAAIVWESAARVPLVRVPRVGRDSVYDFLADLDRGTAVELPMAPRGLGSTYAFLEATRLVLAAGDGQRRVNGYSGFAPPDYDQIVSTLNTFPSDASITTLRRLNVRYVVVHTTPVDTGHDRVSDVVNASGYASVSTPQLATMMSALTPGLATRQIDATDGVIFVLGDGRERASGGRNLATRRFRGHRLRSFACRQP